MVWRKLQGWRGKLLSQATTEVLIKLVVQAIPTYAMGCFKLPLGLCHDIEAMIKKFFCLCHDKGTRVTILCVHHFGDSTYIYMIYALTNATVLYLAVHY